MAFVLVKKLGSRPKLSKAICLSFRRKQQVFSTRIEIACEVWPERFVQPASKDGIKAIVHVTRQCKGFLVVLEGFG